MSWQRVSMNAFTCDICGRRAVVDEWAIPNGWRWLDNTKQHACPDHSAEGWPA